MSAELRGAESRTVSRSQSDRRGLRFVSKVRRLHGRRRSAPLPSRRSDLFPGANPDLILPTDLVAALAFLLPFASTTSESRPQTLTYLKS